MRNLKKILALVLALVMSLSLMATASAAETTAASGTNLYGTAQEVLEALKVFRGDTSGAMNYDQSVTRVQTAALVYRIATSDVDDTQAAMYTNHPFKDVPAGYWGTGYIAYGYNAEILKGYGDGNFGIDDSVTGYQTLAMILRVLGYGKNHEFEGANWEIQTAATARQEHLLDGVSAADEARLGQPATRGLVAQILFNALLQPTVKFSALNPYNYTKDAETLGYQKFGLEEVEGIVIANEYADIRRGNNSTAAAGVTVLQDGDKIYQVDESTGLEDLGETRLVYTVPSGKRDGYKKCIALINEGKDAITYNDGEAISNIASKITGNEAERYLNFGETGGKDTTTIKVTYQASSITDTISGVTENAARARFLEKYHLSHADSVVRDTTYSYDGSGSYRFTYTPSANDTFKDAVAPYNAIVIDDHTFSVRAVPTNSTNYYYTVEIKPGAEYTSFDKEMVTSIFNRADLLPAGSPNTSIVRGEVYRGTQSVTDYSDYDSYEKFLTDCIKLAPEHDNSLISTNGLGWWLKVIDNDNDGVTDWVFQTRYTVARVAAVNPDTGALTLDTWDSTDGSSTPDDGVNERGANITATNESGEELAVGDVVYYAYIDGVNRAWKCDIVEGRVSSINRNNATVTLEGGEPIKESAVHEHSTSTDLASFVINMSGTTNMILYMDKYGNLAAFEQNIAGNFVLLTDGWARNVINGTEYAVTVWDRESKSLKQYNVSEGGNLFIQNNGSANSWNRILDFPGLNNGVYDYTTNPDTFTADEAMVANNSGVRTMVAYMETTDGENARLIPVDTIYDIERQNSRAIRMIDTNDSIPLDTNDAGVIYTTTTAAYQPYNQASFVSTGNRDNTTRVRALASTTYYFVYHTTWNWNSNSVNTPIVDSTGASVFVNEVTGYSAAKSYINDNGVNNYIEDVYVVGTESKDVIGTYYTANVVVVELTDNFYRQNRPVEEVFIYDFPETINYSGLENVSAIRADGTNDVNLKIDLGISRRYTEAENKYYDQDLYNGGNFQPGLYWLHRSSRTNGEDIWYITPMSHAEIRNSNHYNVGTVITSKFTNGDNYVELSNWQCSGTSNEYVHYETTAGTADHDVVAAAATPINPAPTGETGNVRVNGTDSKYYGLSYTGSGRTYKSNLTNSTPDVCLAEDFGAYTNFNRNQVLVRYSGSTIVYAVSFAHGTSTTPNYAPRVWRNTLLSAPAAPYQILFQLNIAANDPYSYTLDFGNKKTAVLTAENNTYILKPGDAQNIDFTVTTDNPAGIGDVSFNNGVWRALRLSGVPGDATWTCRLSKTPDQTKSTQAQADIVINIAIEIVVTSYDKVMADIAALEAAVAAGDEEKIAELVALLKNYTNNEDAQAAVEAAESSADNDTVVKNLVAAYTAFKDKKTDVEAIKALADAIVAYSKATGLNADQQKTGDGIIAACKTDVSNWAQAFLTEYAKDTKKWTNLNAANTAAVALRKTPERIKAYDAVNSTATPTLEKKISDIEKAYAEAKPYYDAAKEVLDAWAVYTGAGGESSLETLVAAYEAAVEAGLVTTEGSGDQPFGLLETADFTKYATACTIAKQALAGEEVIEPVIESIQLDKAAAASTGAYVDDSTADSGYITIYVPKGTSAEKLAQMKVSGYTFTPVLEGFGEVQTTLAYWFGTEGQVVANDGEGGSERIHPNWKGDSRTYDQENIKGTWTKIQLEGAGTAADPEKICFYGQNATRKTVEVRWAEAADKDVYALKVQGGKKASGNINVSVLNMGTGEWLDGAKLNAMFPSNSEFTFTLNGPTQHVVYSDGTAIVDQGTYDTATGHPFMKFRPADTTKNAFANFGDTAGMHGDINQTIGDYNFNVVNANGVNYCYWTVALGVNT